MADSTQSYEPGTHPDLPPPLGSRGVVKWLRENLFSTPTNTVLTLLGVYLVYLAIPPFLD